MVSLFHENSAEVHSMIFQLKIKLNLYLISMETHIKKKHLLCKIVSLHPKIINGTKLLKNVTLQILNFILVKFTYRNFPHMV